MGQLHKCRNLVVNDQYCMNPSCRCKDFFLTFITIDLNSETVCDPSYNRYLVYGLSTRFGFGGCWDKLYLC